MAKKTKNVMVISDLHCGHKVGLTPPSRHQIVNKKAPKAEKKLQETREKLWSLFHKEVKKRPTPDILIVNGDCIEGDGRRSGGTELITTDPLEQADMAAECIKFTKAPMVYMTYGTPSHTGMCTDYENSVVNEVKHAKHVESVIIKSHLYLDVNGCIFDCKHKVGSSGIPHGRHTAIAKEKLWAGIWADIGVAPKADVFIRSHVHYKSFCGADYLGLTTPALQGLGSKYGARQCSGVVDWGFTWFEVDGEGDYQWEFVCPKEANVAQKVEVLKA